MSCPRCELADELERHARLIVLGLEEAREAERLALTDEERQAVREEEALFARLLDRVAEHGYSVVT